MAKLAFIAVIARTRQEPRLYVSIKRAHTGSEAKSYPAGFKELAEVFRLNKTIRRLKMNKLRYIGLAMLAMALMAVSAMAQAPAAGEHKETSIGTGLAILGFGLAAGLAGIGQGLAGSRAAEGAARNPGAASTVQTIMIIALALIESLVLFAMLIVFTRTFGG